MEKRTVQLKVMREIVDRSPRVWLLYLLVGILATGLYFLLPSTTLQNFFVAFIDASVVLAIVAGIFLHRPSYPLPWYLLALGMLFVFVGDILWALYLMSTGKPYPSVADILYLASIPFLVVGLLLIGRGTIGRHGTNLIDPLIIGIGVGMFSWALLMEPGVHIPGSSLLERLLSTAYLFTYLVTLTILVRPLFIQAKRLPALYLLCGSVTCLFTADLAYGSITSGSYDAYDNGSLVYAGMLFSSALAGAAALHPSMAPLSAPASEAPARLTWWRLMLLTGAVMLAPGVLATQAALGQPTDVPLVVGGSAVLFLLVALRMASMMEERKILEQRLEFRAFHDPLTRLPNRSLFMDRFEQALARSERHGSKVAVLFVDLDDFKEVNDSLGHEAGDRVLVAVAHRLRSCLRPTDTAARLGGDEFTMLLEDVEEVEGAVRVAERILAEMRAPVILGELQTVVNVSIGIAAGSGVNDHPGKLLRQADLALYRAKGRGKAGYEVFHPNLEDKINL
jgi:diguanylate cyclase (GGDEF)-like protein